MFHRVLMAAAATLLFAGAAAAGPPARGTSVASTTFTTAYGQSLSIRDLRGNVVILTYWMRDCEVCDVQVAVLDYYYRQRKDMGLKVLAMPEVRRRLADLGQEIPAVDQQTPEALAAWHKKEIELWWPLIKAAGIKVE